MINKNNQLVLSQMTNLLNIPDECNTLQDIITKTNVSPDELSTLYNVIENRIDPIQWIKNNVIVQNQALGPVPFNLYDFQENLIKVWLAKHFIITLKSRQVGMSTIAQAVSLWCALNYSNYNILVLSARDRNATKFLSDIKKMYDLLPSSLDKVDVVIRNEHTLSFENGSKIQALPATTDSARGLSINLLIIDEAAFIEHIDEVYQATYPVISRAFPKEDKPFQKPFGVMIISTPYGISDTGAWYYQMYQGALNGDNNYVPLRVHWRSIPEFDDAWYADQCRNLNWDYRKIMSELELSFVSSGDTFIPNAILDSIGTQEPIYKDIDNSLWIWEEPIDGESYVIGVDTAYGTKNDYSTIQVLKASTLEQVAEYQNSSIIINEYANVVINICKMYKNHICNIENNTLGKILIDTIIQRTNLVGLNLYRDVNPNDLVLKPGQHQTPNDKIGTSVTGANRQMLLDNMQEILLVKYNEALANIIDGTNTEGAREKFESLSNKNNSSIKKKSIVRSERLLNELIGFVRDSHGRVEGEHDDLVMAFVHALYCYSKNKTILNKNIMKILKQSNNITRYEDKYETMRRNIDFMKRSGSSIWNRYNTDDLVDSIIEEEEIEMRNQMKNQNNNNNGDSANLMGIYRALYAND